MATRYISAINGSVRPDTSDVYLSPLSSVTASPTQDPFVWVFIDGATGTLKGLLRIPPDYVDTPVWVISWSCETTANNVRFELKHRTMEPGVSEVDISTSPTEITETAIDTSSKPHSVDGFEEDTISMTTTDLVADEMLYFEFSRLGAHANDTKVDDVSVLDIGFKYADA